MARMNHTDHSDKICISTRPSGWGLSSDIADTQDWVLIPITLVMVRDSAYNLLIVVLTTILRFSLGC